MAACTAADALLDRMPQTAILHSDKGYDSDAVRRKIEASGAAPNIPPETNRRWKNGLLPRLHTDRNAIERMFGRIKDFRRVATRYDRRAQNFLVAVCLVATVCYWLRVKSLIRRWPLHQAADGLRAAVIGGVLIPLKRGRKARFDT